MDEDVTKVQILFENVLSNNNSVQNAANQQIIEIYNTNPVYLIVSSVKIILSDDVPISAQKYSFYILLHAFKPTYDKPVEKIRNSYNSLPDTIRVNIRSAIVRGLVFPQVDVYKQAAFLISILIVIDHSCAKDVFIYLHSLVNATDQPASAHFAAINAYREIFRSNYLTSLVHYCPDIQKIVLDEKDQVYAILRNAVNFPVLFINDVILMLVEFVEAERAIYESPEEQNELLTILEILLPRVVDESLYRSIFWLLFKMVKVLYGCPTFNIYRIISITLNGINCGNENFVNISIDFWNEVIDLENKKFNECEIIDRYEITRKKIFGERDDQFVLTIKRPVKANYSSCFASQATISLINILLKIDPEETDVDDRLDYRPHAYAAVCLKMLFKHEPMNILNLVKSFCVDKANEDSWAVKYSVLLAVSCLYRKEPNSELGNFFKDMIRFIVDCTGSEVPRLAEMAIFTLKRIATVYPIFIENDNFRTIIGLIRVQFSKDPQIVKSALLLLRILIQTPLTPIDDFFAEILESLNLPLKRGDIFESEIVERVFDAIQDLVLYCGIYSRNSVLCLLKLDICGLRDSLHSIDDPGNVFRMQRCFLKTITVIFNKFPDFYEEAKQTLDIILVVIHNVDKLIAEDALLAITHIIPALSYNKIPNYQNSSHQKNPSQQNLLDNELFNDGSIINNNLSNNGGEDNEAVQCLAGVVEYIHAALNSGSPSLISNAVLAITNIFRTDATYLLKSLPSITDGILSCLNNKLFTPDFYPPVAKNLAFIIEAISNDKNLFYPEFRDKSFAVYQGMATLPLEFETENGIEFADSVIECVMLGYSRLIRYSKCDPEFLWAKRMDIYRPVKEKFRRFEKELRFSKNFFCAFMELIDASIIGMPHKANVFINTQLHLRILLYAMSSKDKEICDRAERTRLKLEKV